jgi:hypothetical protein
MMLSLNEPVLTCVIHLIMSCNVVFDQNGYAVQRASMVSRLVIQYKSLRHTHESMPLSALDLVRLQC